MVEAAGPTHAAQVRARRRVPDAHHQEAGHEPRYVPSVSLLFLVSSPYPCLSHPLPAPLSFSDANMHISSRYLPSRISSHLGTGSRRKRIRIVLHCSHLISLALFTHGSVDGFYFTSLQSGTTLIFTLPLCRQDSPLHETMPPLPASPSSFPAFRRYVFLVPMFPIPMSMLLDATTNYFHKLTSHHSLFRDS